MNNNEQPLANAVIDSPQTSPSGWKPNRWWAAILNLFANPLGLLYVQRARLAIIYVAAGIAVGLCFFVYPKTGGMFAGHLISIASILVVLPATVHTFIIATRFHPTSVRKWYSRWYGLIGIAVAWVVFAYTLRAFIVEP